MDKDYIKAIAAYEQAGANLANFATMLFTYHKALCDSGFQRDEALVLVKELQAILFGQAFNFGPQQQTDDEDEG